MTPFRTTPVRASMFTLLVLMLLGSTGAAAQEPPRPPDREPRRQDARPRPPTPPAGERDGPDGAPPPPPPLAELSLSVVQLEHANAARVAELLDRVFGGPAGIRVACDPGTRTLILSAPRQSDESKVRQVIEALDRPAVADRPADRVFECVTLKNSRPETVAMRVIELMPQSREPSRIRVVPSPGASSLWIGGDPDEVTAYCDLARRIDESQPTDPVAAVAARPELHFYAVKHVDAAQLSGTINRVLDSMSLELQVVGDSQSNSIIAYATPAQHEQINLLVERLDHRTELQDVPERAGGGRRAPGGGP